MDADEVRASWSGPPVPAVGSQLSLVHKVEMAWLMKVVRPGRQRRWLPTLPPPLTAEETARRLFNDPGRPLEL